MKLIGTYAYPATRVDSDTNHFNEAISAFGGEISAVLDDIGGSDSSPAPVELYRIDQSSDGSVKLVKVAVGK